MRVLTVLAAVAVALFVTGGLRTLAVAQEDTGNSVCAYCWEPGADS